MKMLTEAEFNSLVWKGLLDHLGRQAEWSTKTFGPGPRVAGVVDHIRKELHEVELCDGRDLEEWIDVVILALDGAWRMGATPEQIINQLRAKQAKNEARQWPDWRTAPVGKAIEHVRGGEADRAMAIQLTDSEVKAIAQNPDVLRAIAQWHDFQQDQADACDMGCHGDERRATELRGEAERIEAEL